MYKQKRLKMFFCILLLTVSSYSNATVFRNINGVDTQWMEISATTGLSRVEVEAMLVDPGSSLYGYRYATRAETQTLFSSYADLPAELNTFYSYPAAAGQQMLNDFGFTFMENLGLQQMTTTDGVSIQYNMDISSYFLHGAADECGADTSCIGRIFTLALDDVVQAWDFVGRRGANQYDTNPDVMANSGSNNILGSLLVALPGSQGNEVSFASIPEPATIWMLLFGLIAVFGFEYRKKHTL